MTKNEFSRQNSQKENLGEQEKITSFAETNYRNIKKRFGIKADDRRHHMYLLGTSRTGKSTTLENMIYQDIQAGHGVAVIDPHGHLAEKVLNFIPSHRINDVVYFNATDTEYPSGFNILENADESYRHFLIVSSLVSTFKKIWIDLWRPRLEYILRNTILALLASPGSTLLGITRMLEDEEFREEVIENLTDPVVKSFWVDEYPKYPERLQTEVVTSVKKKVGQLFSMPLIKNIVGQVKSKINIDEIINEGKILIVNLSKGAIGEDASALLGAMVVTEIQMTVMSRIKLPEDQRRDFYLYIDEFHTFITDSFFSMLSGAGNYHLNLIIAHQYIGQLLNKQNTELRDAVFNNIGTIIAYRVIEEDARFLSKKIFRKIKTTDLVNLDNYNIYLKLMIDHTISRPFSAVTLPPLFKPEGNKDKIIAVSRERYTESRKIIGEKIARWNGLIEVDDDGSSLNQDKYKSKCSNCEITVYLPFIPDGVRPVYCRDCLRKTKRQSEPRKKAPPQEMSLKQVMKQDPISFKNR